MTPRLLLGTIAALSLVSFTNAQMLGAKVGISRFSSGETRDLLGSNKLSIGLSPMSKPYSGGYRLGSDVDLTIINKNGNKLALIPVTYGITTNLGGGNEGVLPYAAARVGVAYADYSITRNATRYSTKKLMGTTNFELGVVVNKNLVLSARYDIFPKTEGFDFNGLGFQATWAITKF